MFEPSEKQEQALLYLYDDQTNFVGYGGAAFGGKSYLLCHWICHMVHLYPGTGWGICRRELTTLKKTTLITLYKVFKEVGFIEGVHYRFNGQLNVFTFYNESQIFLIDLAYKPSDPLFTRLGGYELTGAAVDESAEVPADAIQILFTRLGRRLNHFYGLKKKLLETFNPAKNHVYNRYWKPFRDGTLKPTYQFIRALPTDNPAPEVTDYVQGILDNADQVTIQRLIYGNFEYDDDPDALCTYDALTDLFENHHVQPDEERAIITADVAMQGSDKFVVYVWHGWVVAAVYVFEKLGGQDVVEKLKEIKTRHQVWSSRIVYDADGVGSFIGSSGGFFKPAKPFHNNARALKKENYQNLKAQCGFRMAKRINARQVFINAQVQPGVKEIMLEDFGELKRRNADQDGKLQLKRKQDMITDLGRSPDFLDALIMREYFELLPAPQKRKTKTVRMKGY